MCAMMHSWECDDDASAWDDDVGELGVDPGSDCEDFDPTTVSPPVALQLLYDFMVDL